MARENDEWAIVDSGTANPVVSNAHFASYEEAHTSQITSYPIEDGGSFSANKIDHGYTVDIELVKTGTPKEIQAFTNVLKRYKQSLNYVDVVMPHGVLLQANITEVIYGMNRDTGPRMVRPRIRLEEVRLRKASIESVHIQLDSFQTKDDETTSTKNAGSTETSTLVSLVDAGYSWITQ